MRTTEHILSKYPGAISQREVYKTYPGGTTRTLSDTGKVSKKPRKGSPTGRTNGRLNLATIAGKSGVYAIYEQGPRMKAPTLVYIGMSRTNLYSTVSRHFQNWFSSKGNYKARISYVLEVRQGYKYFFEALPTPPGEAHALEVQLIKKYRPPHNGEKYNRIEDEEEQARRGAEAGEDTEGTITLEELERAEKERAAAYEDPF